MREFLDIAAEIVERDPDLRGCRPVVEKELLHVEILTAMNAPGTFDISRSRAAPASGCATARFDSAKTSTFAAARRSTMSCSMTSVMFYETASDGGMNLK